MMSFGVKFLVVCLPLAIILTNTPTTSGLECYVGYCGTFKSQVPCNDKAFKKTKCITAAAPGFKAICSRDYIKGTFDGDSGERTTVDCNFSDGKDECKDITDASNKDFKKTEEVSDVSISKAAYCTCSKDLCNSKDSLRASGVAGIVIVATIVPFIALLQ